MELKVSKSTQYNAWSEVTPNATEEAFELYWEELVEVQTLLFKDSAIEVKFVD